MSVRQFIKPKFLLSVGSMLAIVPLYINCQGSGFSAAPQDGFQETSQLLEEEEVEYDRYYDGSGESQEPPIVFTDEPADTTPTPTPTPDPVVVAPVPDEPLTKEEIALACATATQTVKTMKITIPNRDRNCPWNKDGNLDKRGAYLQARIEQRILLQNIPKEAVICGLDFKFKPQTFVFDDQFILAFNNHILASSVKLSGLTTNGGIQLYNWSKVRGKKIPTNGVFCAGDSQGKSECSWPKSEHTGTIRMAFDDSLLYDIMSKPRSSGHEFNFVTMGDDNDWDCKHSEIQFDLDVLYFD